jgi:hypothetical protein
MAERGPKLSIAIRHPQMMITAGVRQPIVGCSVAACADMEMVPAGIVQFYQVLRAVWTDAAPQHIGSDVPAKTNIRDPSHIRGT